MFSYVRNSNADGGVWRSKNEDRVDRRFVPNRRNDAIATRGKPTFPQWDGNGFIGGMGTTSLNRFIFDGHGGAKTAERWNVGKRIRDVEEGPDGSLWMLEDANPAP